MLTILELRFTKKYNDNHVYISFKRILPYVKKKKLRVNCFVQL